MANEFTTLLDLAKLKGVDTTEGVLELGQKIAPEIAAIPGRTIAGREFSLPVRTGRPKAGWRRTNEGTETGKSDYDFYNVSCFIASMQLEVDARVADVHPFGRETFLAEEMDGGTRTLFENISSQVYYGDQANDKSFMGYEQFLKDPDGTILDSLVVDAGGTGANLTSVYLVNVGGPHGVKFVFGGNGSFNDQEAWEKTKLKDSSGNKYDGYENGLEFWIGLQLAPNSVVRIANVDVGEAATTNQLTDQLIAKAIQRFPRGFAPTHIFANKEARFSLQTTRSAVTQNSNSRIEGSPGSEGGHWAPQPSDSSGLPIVETDGLLVGEAEAS